MAITTEVGLRLLAVLRWIVDNKEWIFSGVGVTMLLLITRFSRRTEVPSRSTTPDGVRGETMLAIGPPSSASKPTPSG